MKRFFTVLFVLSFLVLSGLGAQTIPSFYISSSSTYGTSTTVDISVTNYVDVKSVNFSLLFDPAIVAVTGATFLPSLGFSNSSNPSPGVFRVGYFGSGCPPSLPDNTVIITLTLAKVANGTSALTFTSLVGDQIRSCFNVVLQQVPYSNYYFNGSVSFLSDTDAPKATLPTLTNQCPGPVSIPVTVDYFSQVGGFDLRMDYASQTLVYTGFTNTGGYPGLSVSATTAGTALITGPNNGLTNGFTLANGATLVTLHFNYLGGASPLTWVDNGASCQYRGKTPGYTPLTDVPYGSFYFNGSVQCTTQVPVWTTQPGALDVTVPCNNAAALTAALAMAPTASAVCNMTVTLDLESDVTTQSSCQGIYTRVRKWGVSDACGQYASTVFTQTITVTITQPPAQPTAGGSVVQCPSQATTPATPVVLDQCGNAITPVLTSVTHTPNPVTCQGSIVYLYTYIDCANNSVTWTYTYTVQLTSPPASPSAGSANVECPSQATPPTTPAVVDACGRTITPQLFSVTDDPDPISCSGTRTFLYRYQDCVGNFVFWDFVYHIDMMTAPTMPAPGGSTVQCASAAINPQLPVFTDYCGRTLTPVLISTVNTPNPVVCSGTRVYTYEVTDCANNTSTWSYTFTIQRSTPPAEIGGPVSASTTINCASGIVAPAVLPVVQDVCGNVLSPAAPVVGGTYNGCIGTITYSYTYTDCANLQFTWTYTYHINRTAPPAEVGAPVPTSGGTVECISQVDPPTLFPVVHDACGNTLTASGPAIGGTYNGCEGTRTYSYTYTDCANLSFVWTYTWTIDRVTPPAEVGGPVANVSNVSCPADAVPPTLPQIVDICGNTLVAPQPAIAQNHNNCEGSITYTYNYQDCSGLPFTWVYTYNILRVGSNPPAEFGGPAPVSAVVACIGDAVAPVLPVVKDQCGITLAAPAPVIGGTWTNCEGTRTYTYNYIDCKGLIFTWVFTYTIQYQDFTVPQFAGSVVSCPDATDVAPTPPVVLDHCGVTLNPTGPVVSAKPVCNGTRTYTWNYTDCKGNTQPWTYTYTVTYSGGLSAPQAGASSVSCPAATVNPGAPTTITDACGRTVVPVLVGSVSIPSTITCNGSVVWTYRYTACDNTTSADWTYTYTVLYNGGLTAPANATATVSCPGDATNPGAPANITDACGRTVVATFVAKEESLNPAGCNGTIIWRYRYTACDGTTTADWTKTYTVLYDGVLIAPASTTATVSCPASAVDPGAPAAIVDACGRTVNALFVTKEETPATVTCNGTIVWRYRYTACDGTTTADWTKTYTVSYSGGLTPPANVVATVSCPAGATDPGTPANITDACGRSVAAVFVERVETPASFTCNGTVVYRYRYTACDNTTTADWTKTYTVTYGGGLTPPANTQATVSCPANATDPGAPANIQDACGRTVTAVFVGKEETPSTVTCNGTIIWRYRYTACDGITTADWTRTYTVNYNGGLTPPVNQTATVSCLAQAIDPGAPADITDACGRTVSASFVTMQDQPASIACSGTRTWVYKYTACDNLTTVFWTKTYTIEYSDPLIPPANQSSTVACLSQATDPGAPANITDACGRTVSAILVGMTTQPTALTCEGDVIWTYRYTACDGTTTADWTYTYTIDLAPAPVVPTNGSQTVECLADAVAPSLPTVTDACGNALTGQLVSTVDDPAQLTCEGTRIYTYSFTDCAQNVSTWSFVYTIDLITPPVVPANGALTVSNVSQAVVPTPPAVTDHCGNAVQPVLISTIDQPNPIQTAGTRTYLYHYTDCGSNTSAWSFVYTIDPTLTPPLPPNGASTVNCIAAATQPTPPAYTDGCSQPVTPVYVGYVDNPNPVTCEGTRVYTYSYTDCYSQVQYWTYTYTIDYIDFTIPAPAGAVVSCPDATDIVPTPPAVNDHCGVALVPVGPIVSVKPTCEGTRTYTWTYTDCASNSHDWVYTYTVDYSGGLTAPQNGAATVACISQAVDPGAPANIIDACGRTVSAQYLSMASTPNPVLCEGSVVYTYRYTACDGITTADWTFTYTIQYQDFTIQQPNGGSVVSCPDATDVVPVPPTVTDHCGNTLTPTGPVVSAKPTCEGTRTYTYTYTDCSGNHHDWVYTYTVDYNGGLTAPMNGTATVACLSQATNPGAPANITDACGRTVSAVFVGMTTQPAVLTCEGDVIWTYRYTACDGTTTADWTYTYTIDLAPAPVVPANGSLTVECLADAVAPSLPSVTDACGNALTGQLVSMVDDPLQLTCEGTRTYTYSFTDCAQNVSTWSFVYTIDLITPPVVPGNGGMTVSCPDATDVAPTPPVVIDHCGNIVIPAGPVVGAKPLCEGTRTYTWTYTDCASNSHAWVYTYTVQYQDFTLPANAGSIVSCPDATDVVPVPPVVSDHCGVLLVPAGPVVSAKPTCEGTRTYTWTYTDCASNSHDWVYTYTVDYSGGLTAPQNGAATVACISQAVDPGAPANIIDACGRTVSAQYLSMASTPNPVLCEGSVVYTYRYTACDGTTTADWTFTYTIQYQDFTIQQPNGGSVVSCPDATDVVPVPPTVTDHCGNTLAPTGPVVSAKPTCEGTRTYTYTYTDCSGNHHDWVYTYTVDYSGGLTPPLNGSATVACLSQTTNPGAPANITDACGRTVSAVFVGMTTQPTALNCEGDVIWIYRYTACDGTTTADWTYTYTIDLAPAPVVPANGSLTVSNVSQAIPPTTPTVTDACGNNLTATLISIVDNPVMITGAGTRTYTYGYTDCAANTSQWIFVYTIDPTLTPPLPTNGASTVNCIADATQPQPPAYTDGCSQPVTPVYQGYVDNPAQLICEGTRTYTWTYTDCYNQVQTWTYTYTIDYIDFTIPAPAGAVVSCPDATDVAPTPPVVSDHCGVLLVPAGPVVSAKPACEGTRTYTWTYTDCASNTHDWVYTYIVDYTGGLTAPQSGAVTVACLSQATDPGAPANIIDACGRTVMAQYVSVVSNPDPVLCEGSVVYTYRYTACDGITTADWTYTYTILYQGFSIQQPNGSSVVSCPNATDVVPVPPTVTDHCGNTLTPTGPVVSAKPTCEGDRTYTWTYTDCAFNTHNWVYTYTVDYSGGLTAPANGAMTVACLTLAVNPGAPADITDGCGRTVSAQFVGMATNPNPFNCEGTVVYTYRYAACDNTTTADWTYTYTIDLTPAPVVPANGSLTVECLADAVAPVLPNVTDACGNVLTGQLVSTVDVPAQLTCEGTRTYTYSFTDCALNTVFWTFTYTIDLNTLPSMPANGAAVVECISAAVPPQLPVVSDFCGNLLSAILVSMIDNPDPLACEGTRTYTYSYSDCAQHIQFWSFVYTIDRTILPAEIGTVAAGSTVQCYTQAIAPVQLPTVADVCGNILTPSSPVTGGTWNGCEGTVTYSYLYTDCANQPFVWTYTYTVDMSTAPVVPVNGAATVQCLVDAIAPVLPLVTDHCGNSITAQLISITDVPTSFTCEGSRTYLYAYTDCAQNTSIWSFVYTVDLITAPVVPANMGANVPLVSLAVPPVTPVVTDACGNTLTAVLVSVTDTPDPITTNGVRIYTYQYTDCAQNSATWTFTYVVDPSSIPVFPANGGSVVQCPSDAVMPMPPVYVDICSQLVTPVYLGVVTSPDPIVCEGTRTYSWSYTDCNNLTNIWTYTYTIDLSTPPAVPANGTATVQCLNAAIAPLPPQVTDHCGRPVTAQLLTVVNTPVSLTCEGTRVYTYSYKDCALNTSLWKFTYLIDRTTPPAISGTPVPVSASVQCQSQAVPPTQLPVVRDVCNAILAPSGPIVGGTFNGCSGTITYTYTYTDCSGLPFYWIFTYTVNMTTPPAVPSNGAATVECIADAVAPSWPVVLDQCGQTITPILSGITDNPDPLSCNGTRTYTYVYTDCAQNSVSWNYTYTILISTPPAVPANSSSVVPLVSMAIPPVTPVVLDACGNSITAVLYSVTDSPDPLMASGTRIYIYHYSDCGGNLSIWTYQYTVDPNLIPVFPANGSSAVECIADAVMPTPPVYTDFCNSVVTPVFTGITDTPDPLTCVGTRVYTFDYTDCTHQTQTWSYTYTIHPLTAPVVPANGSASVECLADALAPVPPVVTDHCGNTLTAVFTGITDSPSTLTCQGTRTYQFTYTDCASNTVNWSYTYTVQRVTLPTEVSGPVPNSANVACLIQATPPALIPLVHDVCGNTLLPSAPVTTTNFNGCSGTVAYSYTWIDCAGVPFVWTFTYNIAIANPPVLPSNGSATVECLSQATLPVPPQVTDECGHPVNPVLFGMVDNPFPVSCQGQRTYTFAYTDCAFNTVYWSFVYTIQRVTQPAESGVPVATSALIECVSDAVPPVQLPVVKDVCGVTLPPSGPVTGGTYVTCSGTITYTYTYVDCAGLTLNWVFTYTIQDNTPPVVVCPGAQQRTMPLMSSVYTTVGNEFDPVSFSDNCGFVSVVNNLNGQNTLSGYPLAQGITTVIWTATDPCGNFSTCSFDVEVLSLTYSGCFSIKAFLQGAFDPNTGLMHDSLRTKGFIPVSEPYSAAPYSATFQHFGGGGGEVIANPAAVLGVTGPNAIVDWVFVELRAKNNPSIVLYTRSALIQRDGDVVGVDGVSPLCFTNMPDDQYYVAIRHRNHLGIMTAAPVNLVPAGITIDFRYGQQAEFDFGTGHPNGINYTGLAQKQVTLATRAMFAGNANPDNKVKYQGTGSDRNTILAQLLNYPANIYYEYNYNFAFGYFSGDVNMDGQLKYQGPGNDSSIILSNLLNYTTGTSQSYDFMIEQLP